MAAVSVPPLSHTHAAILANAGVQFGDVASRDEDLARLDAVQLVGAVEHPGAAPATPRDAATPDSTVPVDPLRIVSKKSWPMPKIRQHGIVDVVGDRAEHLGRRPPGDHAP